MGMESWTDEKHVHFLNSMEAWFVHTMLEKNVGRCNLRLDRHLPDSSESTQDCKHNIVRTRKKHPTYSGSPEVDLSGTTSRRKVKGRPEKRSRRLSSQPHDHSPQDQVVPLIENKIGDKDEKDLPNVPALDPINSDSSRVKS